MHTTVTTASAVMIPISTEDGIVSLLVTARESCTGVWNEIAADE
jgi:hypothetical protein